MILIGATTETETWCGHLISIQPISTVKTNETKDNDVSILNDVEGHTPKNCNGRT